MLTPTADFPGMIVAWGKRRAERDASPLGSVNLNYEALKERDSGLGVDIISHLQCWTVLGIDPGATRLAALGGCPWLSYSAPSVLQVFYKTQPTVSILNK